MVQNESKLTAFLDSPRVVTLYPSEVTTHHYAELYADLRRRGVMIPISDI